MGSFELLIVLLVSFIFLGPAKMIETAKSIGKLLKNAKDMAKDMQEIIIDEENASSINNQPNTKNINNLSPIKFNTNDEETKTISKIDIENEENKIE